MDVSVRYVGARRGVFGLQSWAPVREPGQPSSPAPVSSGSQPDRQTAAVHVQQSPVVNRHQPAVPQQYYQAQMAPGNVQMPLLVNSQQQPPMQRYEAHTAPGNVQLSAVVNPHQPAVQWENYESQRGQWPLPVNVNSQPPPIPQQRYDVQTAPGNTQWPLPVHPQQPPMQQQRHDAQSLQLFTNTTEPVANNPGVGSEKNSSTAKTMSAPATKQRLVAKYDYRANVNSPLGQNAELDLHQFDKMSMIAAHPEQEYWWLVEMDDGRRGYVPANYVMVFEDRITTLPWLANRPVEPLPPVSNLPYKPYKSAYDKESNTAAPNKEYFCEVCQKQLNGPQPYSAHMNSKAHREEVELAAYYKS